MAGTVISNRERTSNKGNRYAFIQMSDTSGVFEVTVFSEILSASRDLLEVGNSLFVKASAQFEGEAPRFTVLSVERLESLQDKSAALIEVFVGSPGALEPLRNVLSGEARGRDRINVVSRIETDREVVVSLPGTYAASPAVIQAIRGIAGVEAVREI
jgi:DNA polymerase-3 subunit alpha